MGDKVKGLWAKLSWLGRPAITRADVIVPRAPANVLGVYEDEEGKKVVV